MTYLFATCILLVAALIFVCTLFRAAFMQNKRLKERLVFLADELQETKNKLLDIQEIYAKADKQKQSVNSGSLDDRFAGSLGVLSDIARTGAGASSR